MNRSTVLPSLSPSALTGSFRLRSSGGGLHHGVPSTAGEQGAEELQDPAPWILEGCWLNPTLPSACGCQHHASSSQSSIKAQMRSPILGENTSVTTLAHRTFSLL